MSIEKRSIEIAKLVSRPFDLHRASYEDFLASLETAKTQAIALADGDWEREEVEKRVLEQKLYGSIEISGEPDEIIDSLMAILKATGFEAERTREILELGLIGLKSRILSK